jgi:hypothetical protein
VTQVAAPPGAPSAFSVETKVCNANTYTVVLSWKDVDGEDGYRIYRQGALIDTIGPNSDSYEDTPPDYNAHPYYVEAFNGSGAAASAQQNSEGCLF